MLFEFVILIAPAFIASLFICMLRNIPVKSLDFLVFAIIFAFLINMFVLGIAYLRGHSYNAVGSLYDNIGVAFKHCGLSLIAAITLPNIVNLIISMIENRKNGNRGINNGPQDE